MIQYTRSQIRAARQKWAEFLIEPYRIKAVGLLDNGREGRCCIGHGCFILNIKQKAYERGFEYAGSTALAPPEFVEMVGLWDYTSTANFGFFENLGLDRAGFEIYSLVQANDGSSLTPQQIGAYLMSVIEGGKNTPFRPLSDYEE